MKLLRASTSRESSQPLLQSVQGVKSVFFVFCCFCFFAVAAFFFPVAAERVFLLLLQRGAPRSLTHWACVSFAVGARFVFCCCCGARLFCCCWGQAGGVFTHSLAGSCFCCCGRAPFPVQEPQPQYIYSMNIKSCIPKLALKPETLKPEP